MPIDKASYDQLTILDNRVCVIPISSGRAVSAGDIFNYLRANGASAAFVSIPSSSEVALAVGSWFELRQAGSAKIGFIEGSGVSIAVRTSGSAETGGVGALVKLTKVASNTWDITGEVSGGAQVFS